MGTRVWTRGTRGRGLGDARSGTRGCMKQTEPVSALNEYKIQFSKEVNKVSWKAARFDCLHCHMILRGSKVARSRTV